MFNQQPVVCPAIISSDLVIREGTAGKLSFINCFDFFSVLKFPFQSSPFFVSFFLGNLRGPLALDGSEAFFAVNTEVNIGDNIWPAQVLEIPFAFPPLIFPAGRNLRGPD